MRTLVLLSLIAIPAAAQQGATAAPLSTFDYDDTRPLNARDSLRERIDGVAVRALAFDSPKGGRVTGLLYLPATGGRHPAMLVGHGAPGNCSGYATMTTALAMAKSGAVTICLDAPWARRNEQPLIFTSSDSLDQVQFIIDLRRGVDYLTARRDVDAARVGYIGNSYGGATGALFAGVEPRLKTVVLRVGDGGPVSHFTEPCDSTARGTASVTGCLTFIGPLAEEDSTPREAWVHALLPLEPILFVGRSKAKLLLQNGRRDPLVSPARATRLHQATPAGTEQLWYDSEHRLPNAAMLDGLRFLQVHLGLATPDSSFSSWLEQRTTAPPRR